MNLLREPLLHFIAGGAMLFAGYAWMNSVQSNPNGLQPVRIGEGEVRWLQETWASQWSRQPSTHELQGLIADLVTEELLAREAKAMGLDDDDTIIRRRLAQKLKFLVEDTAHLVEPTENELQQFYAVNANRFRTAAQVSFTQIFFSSEQRNDPMSAAKAALTELQSTDHSNSAGPIGDRLLIDAEFNAADEQTVANVFGPDFAREVFTLHPSVWSGPVKSGYGVHLVLVTDLTVAKQRPFAVVRDEVLKEWRREKERTASREYIARLREKYGVGFEDSVKALVSPEPVADMARR
jgi:predicted HAD superfamily phosphohydrolase YqeG